MSRKIVILTLLLTVISIATVLLLFLFSEQKVHYNNDFTRRYANHPITKLYDLQIRYNSYYISGFDAGKVYLGNETAPLHVLELNLKTKDTHHIKLKINDNTINYQLPKIKIYPPYFFVLDGSVPVILRGKIGEWKADVWMLNEAYFSTAIPVDTNAIYISTLNSKTRETTLGLLRKNKNDVFIKLNSKILEKQLDGIFDVDGTMMVSNKTGTLGYSYFYRNQFMLINSEFELIHKQKTLDTVTVAQIGYTLNDKSELIKMNKPPQYVNRFSTMFDDYVFVNSDRLGKFEVSEMLKEATIVDVYNWKQLSYEFSFYIYNIGKYKAREFQLNDQYLVVLIEDKLSVYRLNQQLLNTHKL